MIKLFLYTKSCGLFNVLIFSALSNPENRISSQERRDRLRDRPAGQQTVQDPGAPVPN